MDKTVRVFDEFYDIDMSVSANEYEVVASFFREYCSNVKTASSFTETLFRVSALSGVPIMELLDSFRGEDSMKITLTMAYYLNSLGNKTVMYGISNMLPPNQLAQRNVVL
jgi:hypothetical protein